MTKVVAIMGSYRKSGVTDTVVGSMLKTLTERGAEVVKYDLRDAKIEFCTNCRQCTQKEGPARGQCVLQDDFGSILDEIATADAIILAAPTNFFTVNALTKRFIERLVCLAYWPFGKGGPTLRTKQTAKKAVIVTSTAMPGVLGRLFTSSMKILKIAARTLGAKVVGSLFVGSSVLDGKPRISPSMIAKADKLARRLL